MKGKERVVEGKVPMMMIRIVQGSYVRLGSFFINFFLYHIIVSCTNY